MKFNKYCVTLLVCVVFLLPTESAFTDEDNQVNILNAAIPNLAGLSLLIPPPVGPIMAGSLGLFHVACVIFADINADNNKAASTAISQLDLQKTQQAIQDSIKNVDNHVMESSAKVIRELTNIIESHEFMENLRKQIFTFHKSYNDNMKLILNPNKTGNLKNATVEAMLNYYSPFRENLRSFISTYIKPSAFSPTSGPVKLFYDFVLEKDHLLAIENDDCYTDSVESKVFRSYLYILKTLTDSYLMVISTHLLQYQQELRDGRLSDADSTKTISEEIINDYRNDMKDLFEKTKWTLDNASRDIKNCGVFTELKEGVDYEHLSFAKILPRPTYMGEEGCIVDDNAPNWSEYQVDNCDFDADLPQGSHLSIYYNTNNNHGPFQSMKVQLPNYADYGTYGHEDSLMVRQSKTDARCKTVFCNAYKKEAFAISTERVFAQPGNVITGIRFRLRKNVLYIDIQQGKYLDPISVDPKTVFWSETPESKKVAYLGSTVNKIELGSFVLENGFLQEIQLYHSRNDKILNNVIHPTITGSSDPLNEYGPYFNGPYEPISENNEVRIKKGDDPVILGGAVKNLVSKAPKPNQPHFITFQPSDFKKDFGRSTVPFIDIREVVSNPPAPCGGFGIYHQAGSGSGGFLSLKLLAPNLSYLIDYKQIELFANSSTKALL